MERNSIKEQLCAQAFAELGECYHLWTPEDFELIFTNEDEFKMGMGIVGIAAKLYPDVIIITFELMSNHLHITASGLRASVLAMFGMIKIMLRKMVKSAGRNVDWDKFEAKTRNLNNLEDIRNVIVYDNRNGYVVSPDHSPYSYPWGANKYFFNHDACRLAKSNAVAMTYSYRRQVAHSHIANKMVGLLCFDGYALPLSFCNIALGERMFRDASHYFYKISRSIEQSKDIAKEIGESIFYTDNELYASIASICQKTYGEKVPSRLNSQDKIALAKTMRFEYNASVKQIHRMLKIDIKVVCAALSMKQ